MIRQRTINFLGWILVLIGTDFLLVYFVNEAAKTSPQKYFLWYEINMIREPLLSLSVILIFGGIVLATMYIIPSRKENNPLDAHKIRFALGEISKEQYEQMKKELEK